MENDDESAGLEKIRKNDGGRKRIKDTDKNVIKRIDHILEETTPYPEHESPNHLPDWHADFYIWRQPVWFGFINLPLSKEYYFFQ